MACTRHSISISAIKRVRNSFGVPFSATYTNVFGKGGQVWCIYIRLLDYRVYSSWKHKTNDSIKYRNGKFSRGCDYLEVIFIIWNMLQGVYYTNIKAGFTCHDQILCVRVKVTKRGCTRPSTINSCEHTLAFPTYFSPYVMHSLTLFISALYSPVYACMPLPKVFCT